VLKLVWDIDFALGVILPIIVHLHVAMTVLKEFFGNTNHWEPKFWLHCIRSSQISTSSSRRFLLELVAGISSSICLVVNLHEPISMQIHKRLECHVG
jgi:hypothetical protein